MTTRSLPIAAGTKPANGMNMDTEMSSTNPRKGAPRNTARFALAGTMVSFPQHFRKSYHGCRIGGPTRFCILATSLLFSPMSRTPMATSNSRPGNTRI